MIIVKAPELETELIEVTSSHENPRYVTGRSKLTEAVIDFGPLLVGHGDEFESVIDKGLELNHVTVGMPGTWHGQGGNTWSCHVVSMRAL